LYNGTDDTVAIVVAEPEVVRLRGLFLWSAAKGAALRVASLYR